ncbi:MAG: CtsR family transcriptional regulator, partial [Clostridia bacterium]|nr:CtsR family transcriptional regulator [Clostridia bacterium]
MSNFLSYGIISSIEAKLLKVATSDNVLCVPQEFLLSTFFCADSTAFEIGLNCI